MYEPLFNTVLVEIDNSNAKWGGGNDESMLGESFQKGKVIRIGSLVTKNDYPWVAENDGNAFANNLEKLVGKNVIWNEGSEAGTVFEFDGKQFGLIYWWDLRGAKVEP